MDARRSADQITRSQAVFRQKTWADASKHRKCCESSHLCPLWRFLGTIGRRLSNLFGRRHHIHTAVGTPVGTRVLAGQRKPRHVVQLSSLPRHLLFALRHMRPLVTVQTCGDLPTIRPIVEGQPSTVFPLQTVSVPSNVNSYVRWCATAGATAHEVMASAGQGRGYRRQRCGPDPL